MVKNIMGCHYHLFCTLFQMRFQVEADVHYLLPCYCLPFQRFISLSRYRVCCPEKNCGFKTVALGIHLMTYIRLKKWSLVRLLVKSSSPSIIWRCWWSMGNTDPSNALCAAATSPELPSTSHLRTNWKARNSKKQLDRAKRLQKLVRYFLLRYL